MKKKPFIMATCCMAGSLIVATPVYASTSTAGVAGLTSAIIESELNNSSPVAGVSLTLASCLDKNAENPSSSVENVTSQKEKVASASSEPEAGKKEKKAKTNKKKTSEFDNMAVAQVNDYVNIRKKPDENSQIEGKLYNNSVATVVKKKGDWYKVRSGMVTGYIKGDYVVVGDEKLVKSVGVKIATVNTTTLKVRSAASEKAETLTLVPAGEQLKVESLKKYDDGWVKVEIEGGNGFVSADYVEISREYTYAESRAEEEARLAEEERQRQAEEDARNAANQTSSDSQSSTGSSSSSSSSTGSGSSSSGSSSSGSSTGSSSSGSSSASSSGQAVVNYACQFVGNPYVYGGSSLTNGTDCSGFVMSVYAHFGVSLPHSSSAMRSVGYGVSLSEAQPGDIICYSGHVAIYVGNNTIVHASTPATGIKYTSPADYRTVVAVRRIF